MGCLIQVCTDFTPVKWPWRGMKTGYVYVKTAEIKDRDGAAINITADSFSIQIKNSAGVVVETLTTPAGGLTISGTNKLNIKVGVATTATAGVYTGLLVWTRVSTGAIIPISKLTFTVTGIEISGDSASCVCSEGEFALYVPIGVQGDPGLVTLAMFSAFMVQYLTALPRFRSVEVATGAPNNLVPGAAFIWANDTDVGIPGGLTTVPIP